MNIRYANDQETAEWDTIVPQNPDGGNVLQGKLFAEIKQLSKWQPRYIVCDTAAFTALEKHIPVLGKVWYIPKGPGVRTVAELQVILIELVPFAKKQGVFTIKVEPELLLGTELHGLKIVPTKPIQYNSSTVVVDLTPDLEAILKALPQKGRHAIRRAERDGVTVEMVESTPENCDHMYNLFKETAVGAGFVIRPRTYYHEFYSRYSAAGQGQLFFAYFDGKLVAGAYVLLYGDKSTYKDGASVREKATYGASHYLQWKVIEWAKSKGSVAHDLCGTPPAVDITNETHPFYGLGRFKTSFNKTVTDYVGAYEVPVIGWKSALWTKFAEKVVRRLYFIQHHESYY
ncbi:peptidoglycan bridge formation glycyltransferase FemA/FemB family protein [Candidatus Saccharibacteria bacterium]|nr:peptidoglycan bridge formation glycyltransferase FemA/FemB family protein [Candidatus Saccharibacteria bacterium]